MNHSLRIDKYHIGLVLFLFLSLGYNIVVKFLEMSTPLDVGSLDSVSLSTSDFSEVDPFYSRAERYAQKREALGVKNGFVQAVILSSGSSFYQTVLDLGTSVRSAYLISKAAGEVYNISKIKAGEHITIEAQTRNGESVQMTERPERMLITFSDAKVEVMLDKSTDKYKAIMIPMNIESANIFVEGEVKDSLYADAEFMGVPPTTIMNFIRLFSYDVDFQRDIGANSKFRVLYTSHVNESGKKMQGNEILYASLTTKGQEIEVYRYTFSDGTHGYFHKDGSSIKKSLLKTPIKSAKISSGFGMRKHPILGYSRMHKGLDYAAPRGTPVLAAGDGVVEIATSHKAYGKYVKIKHDKKHDTLYAHLEKFNNVKTGKKVKQGEIIGFVGNSGMSTGSHLHYEVHVHGKQINPANADLMRRVESLDKRSMKSFRMHQASIEQMIRDGLYASNAPANDSRSIN